mmetsp:Transcript_1774/g.7081  ORF Transcript_1774/g.7081 Transcript_1774/m.7081 type:complete len:319 (+) Transcript_1774:44-1000(+)
MVSRARWCLFHPTAERTRSQAFLLCTGRWCASQVPSSCTLRRVLAGVHEGHELLVQLLALSGRVPCSTEQEVLLGDLSVQIERARLQLGSVNRREPHDGVGAHLGCAHLVIHPLRKSRKGTLDTGGVCPARMHAHERHAGVSVLLSPRLRHRHLPPLVERIGFDAVPMLRHSGVLQVVRFEPLRVHAAARNGHDARHEAAFRVLFAVRALSVGGRAQRRHSQLSESESPQRVCREGAVEALGRACGLVKQHTRVVHEHMHRPLFNQAARQLAHRGQRAHIANAEVNIVVARLCTDLVHRCHATLLVAAYAERAHAHPC